MATREPTSEELLREAIELYRDGIAADRRARSGQSQKPKRGFWWYFMNVLVAIFLLSFLAVVTIEFFLPMIRPEGIVIQPLAQRTPLPTAVLPQPPAQQQYQQLPAAPPEPIQQQVAPAQSAPQPTAVPPVAAPVVVPQPVEQVAQPAPVEAPLPAPSDPAFESSFEYQSDAANSPFVGCLPGRDCNPSYSQPTALPGPNEPGFRESFK